MKVLIFGGAAEGRKLSASLLKAGIDVTLSVATEFGRDSAANIGMTVLADRLGAEDMTSLLKQDSFACVIDATHPYSVLATQNIRSACHAAGLRYLRLKRPENARIPGITYVSDAGSAAEMLDKCGEKALLTIGSKELESFTHAANYGTRFFVRILPMPDSLEKALGLGFHGSNIICMQGPFDKEMNMATLKMTGVKYLVTKDSGDEGGFEAKVSAGLSLGCEVIVISRPLEEEGYTLGELLELFGVREVGEEAAEETAFFPVFVDINGKKLLITGGGKVAERRIKVLASFGADLTVISPKVTGYIKHAALQGHLRLLERKYQNGDIAELKPFLVIAATNDRQANRQAKLEAESLNIKVSVADCREECTFHFPAIAEGERYVAGIVSKNGDHAGVKRVAEKIRICLQ